MTDFKQKNSSREKLKEEFHKYVYNQVHGKYVYTKVKRELVEHDLFELKPEKMSLEYFVRLLVWYGETNFNVIRDLWELRDQVIAQREREIAIKIRGLKGVNVANKGELDFDYVKRDEVLNSFKEK